MHSPLFYILPHQERQSSLFLIIPYPEKKRQYPILSKCMMISVNKTDKFKAKTKLLKYFSYFTLVCNNNFSIFVAESWMHCMNTNSRKIADHL